MTVNVSQVCPLLKTEHGQLLSINKPIVRRLLILVLAGMDLAMLSEYIGLGRGRRDSVFKRKCGGGRPGHVKIDNGPFKHEKRLWRGSKPTID